MKLLKTLLLCLAFASPAFAVLTANCQWSVIQGGSSSTNNGGMFDPSQTAGMLTNLASTSSSSATPTFSSASYTFVAGDVGNWVFVGAGSGWVTGFYKITSLSGNNAVVDAAIGHVITYSPTAGFGLSTAAGCGATASGTFSVDYAGPGKTSNNVTNSTFASAGSSTNLTDGSSIFTPVMVGNAVHITNTGTGGFGILGWFTITAYTNATTVVTDRTTNTGTAMVAGTGFIGGSNADIANINSASAGLGPIAGNIVWMNGTFAETTTAITIAFAGSAAGPIKIEGYGTYWGDGYLGRTNSSGALTTTNQSFITFTTGTFALATWDILEDMNFSGASTSGVVVISGNDNVMERSVVTCTSNSAAASALKSASGSNNCVDDSDIFETGTTGTTQGIAESSANLRITNCRITMSSNSATSYGIDITSNSTPIIIGNQLIGAGIGDGVGISVNATGARAEIDGNTIAGWGDGINVINGNTLLTYISNNMLTDCTNPLNAINAGNAIYLSHNRYRANTSGGTNAVVSGGPWTALTNYAPVISSLSLTDYNSLTDLRLVTGSPALGAGIPKSAAIGAVQSPAGGAGEVSTSSAK